VKRRALLLTTAALLTTTLLSIGTPVLAQQNCPGQTSAAPNGGCDTDTVDVVSGRPDNSGGNAGGSSQSYSSQSASSEIYSSQSVSTYSMQEVGDVYYGTIPASDISVVAAPLQ
jgi:hypothetical protein